MISRALHDPEWKSRYADKVKSRERALGKIPRGARIFIGSACGEPQYLVEGLTERAVHMVDTEILHILTLGIAPYADPEMARQFRHNAYFIGENVRQAVAEGRADYTPVFLSELPDLFRSRRNRLDAALIQVSPPDKNGYVSMGVSVDVTKAAVEAARYVVAEVNNHVPRTHGYSFLHVDEIDAMVAHDTPLIEYQTDPPNETALRIAKIIAKLVEDGSTIQIGIGVVPYAVVPALMDKNDLGVHTETFADWLMDLTRAGVVTNKRKTLHPGKSVGSFCMGSQELYEYIDTNPMISLHPSEYTNDPHIIAQNDRMVAVNTALELDLTGQICSDSIGHRFYSGIGGQVDFIRGASRSKGGKPIIAIASTAKEGTVSTIVPRLSEGAGVVTTRGAVRYVVTEWGYADLHGKSIRERALALINIAHPDYREWLLEEAKAMNYIYHDQILPPRGGRYPEELESRGTFGGKGVTFRPIKPTDEANLKELFYSLTDESIFRRYFSTLKVMPHDKLQHETNLDFETRMAIVVIPDDARAEEIIAICSYEADISNNEAETSFLVRDDWQGKGLGRELIRTLIDVARQKHLHALTAVVHRENRAMLHLFLNAGFDTRYVPYEDAYFARLVLEEDEETQAG